MRQVPDNSRIIAAKRTPSARRYAILGNGRLARHLRTYFSAIDLMVVSWSRCGDPKANTFPDITHGEKRLQRTLAHADVALVLFSDPAIIPFVEKHQGQCNDNGQPVQWVHCAASVVNPLAFCAHPLMTFSHRPYALETYQQMAFACDDAERFGHLFPALPNPVFSLSADIRPLYHALCVLAGNIPQIIWQGCLQAFDDLHVPRQAVETYLRQVLANFLAAPNSALTGPLARGDQHTIDRHLHHLQQGTELQTALAGVYRAATALHAAGKHKNGDTAATRPTVVDTDL